LRESRPDPDNFFDPDDDILYGTKSDSDSDDYDYQYNW